MRNIFDQYSQPENRLTHALVSCLGNDPKLLRGFVQWATGEKVPADRRLEIVEQRLPGEEEATDEKEAERRGLPDAWIHDGKGWALIIESKIESPLKRDQLDRHRRVAERRSFSDVHLVALVVEKPKRLSLDGLKILEWTELYSWLRQEGHSEWARRLVEYMEVLERKLAADEYLREGTLTVFAGIPFGKDNPYNYPEAKRTLRLAMDELRKRKELKRKLGMDPEGEGRPAITGREGTSVWDFLPLAKARSAKNFTEFPHLTLAIQQERLLIIVTVPNGIRREFRRNLLSRGKDGFLALFEVIHGNLAKSLSRVEGAAPLVEIVQRHYPSQRAQPVIDSRLQFDLRTAFRGPKRWRKPVKPQPQWLEAVYEALSHKRSNLQVAVGAIFPYGRCKAVNSREILDHVANTWLACRPLIRAAVR
jgi:hypothetical protein